MDIIFDAEQAELLVNKINDYCETIDYNGGSLLDVLDYGVDWDDSQREYFRDYISDKCNSLKEALIMEYEYKELFSNKIKELKG